MQIGIIGRAFTDRPSRIVIVFLLKLFMIMVSCDYLLSPAKGSPIVNIGVDEQSAATSSGYVQYKVDNASAFDEMARKAFISLHSEPYIEPPLLTADQKRLKWLQRFMRKQLKFEKKGKKIVSSPKEALHLVNQEVSLGRLDNSRPAAHCEGQIFKQRVRMDGCLTKVTLDCPSKNPKQLKRKVIKVKKCKCIALNDDNPESEEDDR